jgi:NADH:ubiquinone oxidoreductase subunit F (NADH-binding)/(2Fe-2S) ferredoxin/Pyruvate/2-oxoacid:ferredoxin oxidoreductase delta subunit
MKFYRSHVLACVDPQCVHKGAHEVIKALKDELISTGLLDEVQVLETSRIGGCDDGPELMVYPEGVHYSNLTPDDIPYLVDEHFLKGRICQKFLTPLTEAVDEELSAPTAKEVRVVLRNCGKIDPENIEDYIAEDGYMALAKVLAEKTPEEVIDHINRSGLRGRGGAGFPTAKKWAIARQSLGTMKYIICNADEGDPGAFMNRRVLEGDPHSVLEGMAIAAYAIGNVAFGYIYCRAEYPIAVRTLNIAIGQARNLGLLGKNILNSGFDFDVEVRMGAGAFVCGEETALIASIEGKRGEPRPRPPFPSEKGLWGKPTSNNNVETYANIPQIILKGPEWFAGFGTEKSKGTKTFALAGDVKHTGLIEVPLGITLRELVYDVGGGIKEGKGFKAIQIGGPMGGCLTGKHLDLKVDYESLISAGAMMGSGGVVVMDEDTCMVDIARFFMDFIQDESCGKCVPCRIGTRRMLETLNRITSGQGRESDITDLELLCEQVRQDSLCGLGQGAPNPVASTLKHFRNEYEAHIKDKKCPAKVCKGLITYEILASACTGCTVCARNCPVTAITGEKKQIHKIDADICIRCGICKQVCNFNAITIN